MALINLKTDLKSLKFGKDRLDGGSSNQPYVQTPIPKGTSTLNDYDNDFLLRGGIRALSNTNDDVLRIGKYFFDTKSPSGLLFTAKQNLLSRTAVRTQSSTILNEGVYSPTNTLAQVGVSAFGLHFYKQGINPSEITTYSDVVKFSQPIGENRLITLSGSSDLVNVLSYGGGPGSDLGIGSTNIKFADQRTGDNNPLKVSNPDYFYGKNTKVIDNLNYNLTGSSRLYTQYTTSSINNSEFNNFTPSIYKSGSLTLDPSQSKLKQGINVVSSINYNLTGSSKLYTQYTQQSSNNSDFNNFTPSIYKSGSLTLDPNQNILKIGYPTQNLTGPNGSNYNWYNNGTSKLYYTLTNTLDSSNISSYWNIEEGKKLWITNVYTPPEAGTFHENTDAIDDQGTFTYSQQDLIDQEENAGKLNGSPSVQDFRAVLRNKLQGNQRSIAEQNGATPFSPDYTVKNIETRVNLGDPGKKQGKSLSSYTNGSGIGPVDKLNAFPIQYKLSEVTPNEVKNDLVKFRIAVINNQNPSEKSFIHFRAFLDSFSDSYSSEWASHKFLGRAENFYTYGGFTRTLSLSWTVAAQSKEELIPMYQKLNYLASSLAPDYSGKGFMKGNLIQLTVGGYLYEQVGFFEGIDYELINDAPWEIAIDDEGNSDSSVKELPHMIKVSGFKFTPIQDFVPSIGERFISLSNGSSTNY